MLKILPLGDSITFGCGDTCGDGSGSDCKDTATSGFLSVFNPHCNSCAGGYRVFLENLLGDSKYTFVGTRENPTGHYHNGYPGWPIQWVHSKIDEWILTDPDIILLHLGTNNLGWKMQSAETACNEMRDLLIDIKDRVSKKHVTVYLATIMSSARYYGGRKHRKYNECLRKVAQELSSTSFHIKICEMEEFSGEMCNDKIHPTRRGYRQMSKMWARCISGRGEDDEKLEDDELRAILEALQAFVIRMGGKGVRNIPAIYASIDALANKWPYPTEDVKGITAIWTNSDDDCTPHLHLLKTIWTLGPFTGFRKISQVVKNIKYDIKQLMSHYQEYKRDKELYIKIPEILRDIIQELYTMTNLLTKYRKRITKILNSLPQNCFTPSIEQLVKVLSFMITVLDKIQYRLNDKESLLCSLFEFPSATVPTMKFRSRKRKSRKRQKNIADGTTNCGGRCPVRCMEVMNRIGPVFMGSDKRVPLKMLRFGSPLVKEESDCRLTGKKLGDKIIDNIILEEHTTDKDRVLTKLERLICSPYESGLRATDPNIYDFVEDYYRSIDTAKTDKEIQLQRQLLYDRSVAASACYANLSFTRSWEQYPGYLNPKHKMKNWQKEKLTALCQGLAPYVPFVGNGQDIPPEYGSWEGKDLRSVCYGFQPTLEEVGNGTVKDIAVCRVMNIFMPSLVFFCPRYFRWLSLEMDRNDIICGKVVKIVSQTMGEEIRKDKISSALSLIGPKILRCFLSPTFLITICARLTQNYSQPCCATKVNTDNIQSRQEYQKSRKLSKFQGKSTKEKEVYLANPVLGQTLLNNMILAYLSHGRAGVYGHPATRMDIKNMYSDICQK